MAGLLKSYPRTGSQRPTTRPATSSNIPAASTSAWQPPSGLRSADASPPSRPPLTIRTTHIRLTRTRTATHTSTRRVRAHVLCLVVREVAKRRLFRNRFQSRLGQGRIGFRPGPRLLREHRRESFHAATPTATCEPAIIAVPPWSGSGPDRYRRRPAARSSGVLLSVLEVFADT